MSNKQRGEFLASYRNPVSLLNLTPEIVDRLFNDQTDSLLSLLVVIRAVDSASALTWIY